MSPASSRQQPSPGEDSQSASPPRPSPPRPGLNKRAVSSSGSSSSQGDSQPASPLHYPSVPNGGSAFGAGTNSASVRRASNPGARKQLVSPDLTKAQLMAGNAAAVAAFASQGAKRPSLKVFPPHQHKDDAPSLASAVHLSPFGDLPDPLARRARSDVSDVYSLDSSASSASNSTLNSQPPAQPRPQSSSQSSSQPPASTKRLWFRKKSGGSATSLIVGTHELIDDLKLRILERYPTSLQQRCDPADLVLTVPQSSGIRLELQPDENVIEVMERYFPAGMKMSEALEVGPSASMWTSPGAANHTVRNNTPRSMLQRARSYSNTQSYTSVPPSALNASNASPFVPLPSGTTPGTGSHTPESLHGHYGSPQAKPGTPVQEVNGALGGPNFKAPLSPASEHAPHLIASRHPSANSLHSNSSHSISSSSSSPAGQGQAPQSGASSPPLAPTALSLPDRRSRNINSVLLLPRKLPLGRPQASSEKLALGEYGTKLVPLTGSETAQPANQVAMQRDHERDDLGGCVGDETREDSHSAVVLDYRTSLGLLQLQQMLSPSLHMSQGKQTVVPQINILIVEDNPVNQRILEAFMKRKKVRYAVANNGREALEKWKVGGFHLILMDIQLPVMTGLEATKEIRRLEIVNGIGAFPQAFKDSSAPPAPHEVIKKSAGGFRSPVIIVALTASSDSDDKSEALAAGCNDFLTKPVNFMWLEKKIIEWGCMQALIDFDGWKKWSEDGKDSPGHSARSSRRGTLQGQQDLPSLYQPSLPLKVQAP